MAKELLVKHSSGRTVYAVGRIPDGDTEGQWLDPTVPGLVEFNGADWINYAIPLTELGNTGLYEGDFPVAATAPTSTWEADVIYLEQAGDDPAMDDTVLSGFAFRKVDGWRAGNQLSL